MKSIILHSDMNNFYASVECMLNPKLKNEYVAVCGRTEDRHGIVLAKNERAKTLGVKTGEPVWQAKLKCPNLVTVEPHFDQYLKYSKLAHEIYFQYTDKIEPYGMDECWLDVSGSTLLYGNGYEIAQKIKEQIKNELNLTVSIGVSFNKIFAKLGSDMKKPDAITCISEETFREKIWGLSACELLGVGRATAKKLLARGVFTIGDLAQLRPELLKKWFGINGVKLWNYANGRDYSRVADYGFSQPIKSIGHGITCTEDLGSNIEVWRVILSLSSDIATRLRKNKLSACGIHVSVKDTSLFQREFGHKISKPCYTSASIAKGAFELFKENYTWEKQVRAVSIRATDLTESSSPTQISMFDNINHDMKVERIEKVFDDIRSIYGKDAVKYGTLLMDTKIPPDKNVNLVMPSMMYV